MRDRVGRGEVTVQIAPRDKEVRRWHRSKLAEGEIELHELGPAPGFGGVRSEGQEGRPGGTTTTDIPLILVRIVMQVSPSGIA